MQVSHQYPSVSSSGTGGTGSTGGGATNNENDSFEGTVHGPASLIIPAYVAGGMTLINTDDSAEQTLQNGHQYVTNEAGKKFPEGAKIEHPYIPGKVYKDRHYTFPEGISGTYTYTLA